MQRFLSITRGLLEQPTAPEKEQLPQAYVRAFVKKHSALKLKEDPSGNLLVKYSPPKAVGSPLVLVAHLDHPGFWVETVEGRQVTMRFKGYVQAQHVRAGIPIQFFALGQQAAVGQGRLQTVSIANGQLSGASAVITSGRAVAGGFAMWRLPAFKLHRNTIFSRACDDLAGAAAILCVLDELLRLKPRTPVWGLFTRSEEAGFYGALEAVRHKIIPKSAWVLSIESPKALPHAPQGGGAIVRVGDRSSVYDPRLCEAIRQTADALQKRQPKFTYQRRLMDGGTTEATVFNAYGYRAAGVCLPMGNYHNQAVDLKKRPGIGAETCRVSDFISVIQLLVELARQPEALASQRKPKWLLERAKAARKALER